MKAVSFCLSQQKLKNRSKRTAEKNRFFEHVNRLIYSRFTCLKIAVLSTGSFQAVTASYYFAAACASLFFIFVRNEQN